MLFEIELKYSDVRNPQNAVPFKIKFPKILSHKL